jgi:hypothetical protein
LRSASSVADSYVLVTLIVLVILLYSILGR